MASNGAASDTWLVVSNTLSWTTSASTTGCDFSVSFFLVFFALISAKASANSWAVLPFLSLDAGW